MWSGPFLKEKEFMQNLQGVSSKKCAIKHLSNEIKNGGSSGSNQSPNNCTDTFTFYAVLINFKGNFSER